MGTKARQTQALLLKTAKQLFLERGYGGTKIEHITEACGISRAGFYTYFPSKRDLFLALGETTYRDHKAVLDKFDELPDPCTTEDLKGWVGAYFELMDEHGAFMLGAAQTSPNDEDLKAMSRTKTMKMGRKLGKSIRARQASTRGDEAALGLTVMAMLDHTWYYAGERHPIDEDALLDTAVEVLARLLHVARG